MQLLLKIIIYRTRSKNIYLSHKQHENLYQRMFTLWLELDEARGDFLLEFSSTNDKTNVSR